jgi:hypothetical protein
MNGFWNDGYLNGPSGLEKHKSRFSYRCYRRRESCDAMKEALDFSIYHEEYLMNGFWNDGYLNGPSGLGEHKSRFSYRRCHRSRNCDAMKEALDFSIYHSSSLGFSDVDVQNDGFWSEIVS